MAMGAASRGKPREGGVGRVCWKNERGVRCPGRSEDAQAAGSLPKLRAPALRALGPDGSRVPLTTDSPEKSAWVGTHTSPNPGMGSRAINTENKTSVCGTIEGSKSGNTH